MNYDMSNAGKREITLDVSGLLCPLPVLRARKILLGMREGSCLRVRATDPVARIDMPHFCAQAGHEILETSEEGATLVFLIRRGPDREED
ncbi:MAG: sulfurtransferase TusA family protein [Rhizobiales bacterium]|nr:sulfurtransferase TusA family protein [Hyphomicrobiales bacterium]